MEVWRTSFIYISNIAFSLPYSNTKKNVQLTITTLHLKWIPLLADAEEF